MGQVPENAEKGVRLVWARIILFQKKDSHELDSVSGDDSAGCRWHGGL